jgi:hypothetical protein
MERQGESVWMNRRDKGVETSTDCVLTGHAARNIKFVMSDREESMAVDILSKTRNKTILLSHES